MPQLSLFPTRALALRVAATMLALVITVHTEAQTTLSLARLAVQEERRQKHVIVSARLADVVSWLSPQVAFQTALADLAGTGVARHQAFVRAVREFQLDLRRFMHPHILAQVHSPSRPCPACVGRLNFLRYDEIPRFVMMDAPASSRVAAASRSALWLLFMACAIAAAGLWRATHWSSA
jgi:ABC-2 type transport system permease protein